jgi:uncharacterized coiled-coil DUF342 family protein
MIKNWLDDYKSKLESMKTSGIVKDDVISRIDKSFKIVEEIYDLLNKNPIEDLSTDEGAVWLLAITLSQTRDRYKNLIQEYNNMVEEYNGYKETVSKTKRNALRELDKLQQINDKFLSSLFPFL